MYVHDDYTHASPYSHYSDVKPLPHMGQPEEHIVASFLDAYQPTRALFRTPYFAQLLGQRLGSGGSPKRRVDSAFEIIDPHLLQAESSFHADVYPQILPVTAVAASFARMGTRTDVEKAVKIKRNRFHLTPVSSRSNLRNAASLHVDAAKNLTLGLVRRVTSTQRAKMRTILTQSVTRGIDADVTGTRIANVVGLFPRWQNAVDNYERSLIDGGALVSVAHRRANEYADELLGKRGIMIARTELMRAMNAGRFAGWLDMVDRSVIEPQSIKEWIAAPDACDDCRLSRSERTVYGLDTAFDTPRGPIVMPPSHPHCRCTVNLHPIRPDNAPADADGQRQDERTVNAFPDIANLLDRFGVAEGFWG